MNEHYIALEFDKVLLNLSKYASSKLSSEACLNLEVLNNKEKIEYELSLVDSAKKLLDDNKPLVIDDISDIKEIFKQSHFLADEIVELAHNLRNARLARNFILSNEYQNLIAISNNFYTNKELEDEVFSVFDNELNLLDCASDTLKSLRASYRDNKDNLKTAINNLLQNNSFLENLQDTVVSTREDRPVFQVKASCKNKVQGIVHDVSQTNLTYFIEPSVLVPLSNKLRQIEIEIQAEISRILGVLSEKFKKIYNELLLNQEILIRLDCIFARAKYSIHLHGVSADITDEKIIDIQKMRHPLLVEIKEDVIENDFTLGKDYSCLLITGSNTGGKTVALKCAGLMVLMTKAGLHIPCIGAKIGAKYEIYCDISKEQSLEQGFSTFSAHIKNISDILNSIDENSLILLDELGSGTDPIEGASLAHAILDYIKNKNAQSIVTTHLGELKILKYSDDYFENATVLFDTDSLKPKYNLIIGMSGTSCAIDISQNLGLNSEIISNARNYLKGASATSELFSKIEKTNQQLIKKEQEASITLEKSKEIEQNANNKLDEIRKNKKKSLDSFKRKFQNQLDSARSEIKEIVDEIRREKSLKVAMRSYDRINKLENRIREEFSGEDSNLAQKYKKLDINSLKVGQSVLIKKLDQIVILDSLPDKKGMAAIRIGNIKSKIPVSRLAYTDKKVAPHLKKIEVHFTEHDNLLSRLDLRGMRVIEAIEYLDKNLDKANLRGLNQITVIHGYGTGALKQAVKEYLDNSPYVAKYHYGDETQGRDGVVIIDLN